MSNPSKRTTNFRYAIRNLARAAEAQEQAGREVTYLNIGDPQRYGFQPPAHLVEAVTLALRQGFTGYAHSMGLLEARESVARYATALGAPTDPGDVLITSGASEAAELILTALVDEGDEVLLPAPGYPLYSALLNKLGAIPRYYRLDGSRGWQPSPDEVRSLIGDRTRALVLINPNNPAGSVTPDGITRQLLETAARHKILVIADEVYRELCFDGQPAPSSVMAEAIGAPLITLESLSKTHIIPGWRVGWMRFTNAARMSDLISAVNRLADGRLCAPTPTQYAVRPALEGSREYLLDFMEEIKRRRDLALAHIESIPGLSCEAPQAAFYLMIKVDRLGERTDEEFVLGLLKETGVLVVHGSGFGTDSKEGYFRLVYLADEETLESAFNEIRRYMALDQVVMPAHSQPHLNANTE